MVWSRSKISGIIIPLLLVLLIILQIFWQRQVREKEKKDFQVNVLQVLNKVRSQLKNANTCVTFYSKPSVKPNEGIYIIKQKWDENGFYGEQDTLGFYLDRQQFEKPVQVNPALKEYRSSLPTLAEFTIQIIYDEDEKNFSEVSDETFEQDILNKTDLRSFLDTAEIRHYIANLLSEHGITNSFGFAFSDIETGKIYLSNRIKDTVKLEDEGYSIDVFQENRFVRHQLLTLVFNDTSGFNLSASPAYISLFVILLLVVIVSRFYLKVSKEKKLSVLKNDFINNLNHEMSTPLTNIQLSLESMNNTGFNEKDRQRMLDIINSELLRLKSNIDRSMQIGLLEADKINLNKKRFNLSKGIEDLIEAFRPAVQKAGGSITFTDQCEEDVQISADDMHLLNALSGLLDNALKYKSDKRSLRIEVACSVREHQFIMEIIDNGIGMDATVQSRIFDKFFRGETGLINRTKGFGIGLSYASAILQMHGGDIAVQSTKDQGTAFLITLPINDDA